MKEVKGGGEGGRSWAASYMNDKKSAVFCISYLFLKGTARPLLSTQWWEFWGDRQIHPRRNSHWDMYVVGKYGMYIAQGASKGKIHAPRPPLWSQKKNSTLISWSRKSSLQSTQTTEW